MSLPLPDSALQALATLDSCSVANAIEAFDIRLRNDGFTRDLLPCRFPELPPMVGYAMTLKVHSANPPLQGGAYTQGSAWWDRLSEISRPRVVVIQDADRQPGVGAFVGAVHAAILQAQGCIGVITDGAVRDLPAVKPTGFQLFSKHLSVSHAYMHVVEVNSPVEISGLRIAPGDLLHGDQHGVVLIPPQLARELPAVAERLRIREREILGYCHSPEFTKEGLRKLLGQTAPPAIV